MQESALRVRQESPKESVAINANARVDSLLLEAWNIVFFDASKARELSEEAYGLAEQIGYTDGFAESLLLIARCKGGDDQYEEAVEDALVALQMFTERAHVVGQIRASRVLGFIYCRNGRFDISLDHLFRAVKLLTENGYDVWEGPYPISASLYNNIAYVYAESGRSADALDYFFKAYELTRNCSGPLHTTILINIAETELDMGNTKLALRYNKMALTELGRREHSDLELHTCYNAFGLIYKAMGKYDLSLESFHKARDAARKIGSKFNQIVSTLDIARLYLLRNDAKAAIESIEEVQASAEEIEAQVLMRDIFLVKSQGYEKLQDFEQALKYYKQYVEHSHDVDSREMEQRISRHEAEFRLVQAQKDSEIYRLRNIELKHKSEEIEQKALLLEQSNRTITIISEIGQRITSSLDLNDVFNTIYLSINRLMDASVFAIGFYDSIADSFSMDFIIDEQVRCSPHRISPSQGGYLTECIRSGTVVVDNNVIQDQRISMIVTNGKQPRSAVFCPLLIAGQVLGVLTLQSYHENAYNSNHVDIIRALASYMAIALNNSQQSESLKITARELELLSKTDPLTGLYTRRHIIDKMEEEYRRYQRYGKVFTLMIVDIDHFKRFNDEYGHSCGDHVLVEVSEQMKQMLRQQDCLARWGGEEFLVLLPETNAENAAMLAERLRSTIEQTEYQFQNTTLNITLSFGLSEIDNIATIDTLIMRADHALYAGKRKGRNRVEIFG